MSADTRLKVVLCWHMHQPQYRNLLTGAYALPWTYLHGIKDYVDMAAILEAIPQARAVINFSPIVLEQIDDYAVQVQDYLAHGEPLRDALLAALATTTVPATIEEYAALVKACLRTNEERLVNRFPPYRQLADLAAKFTNQPELMPYLSEQYLADILVWYHLAWMGETVRLNDARIKQLINKGHNFDLHDRRLLLTVIQELLGSVIQRYRALSEAGQIELSVTPYAHPIVPLLVSLKSAQEAIPELDLPQVRNYPGGLERTHWHIHKGKAVFQKYFGIEPHGCWPAEGSISAATLQLLGKSGFSWAASGETVLRNSLAQSGGGEEAAHNQWLYQPYAVKKTLIPCFFRDDGLSDLIGFTYSNWHSDDAVNNLIHHLENIAAANQGTPDKIVSIILDGENAWEYYPDNAYHFLTTLYKKLSAHKDFELTTFSSYLKHKQPSLPLATLNTLVAGSWVYGTFSTWIGEPAKNRAWDMLCEAKHAFDSAVNSGRLQGDDLHTAEEQLAICEGSDWFWWFGDYNPAGTVSDFEKLYRLHLTNLYQLVGQRPPDYLSVAISHGSDTSSVHSGTMRPSQPHT